MADLKVADAEESLALITGLLSGEKGPAADMVALNAGAALYVANVAESMEAGVKWAKAILAQGEALDKMQELASVTQMIKGECEFVK